MRVRCPNCHNPLELADDTEFSDIECPGCGSSFSLLGEHTATMQASDARTIGHFDLLEQVGVGAFGSVWKARDTKLDRTVAVKIPRKGQLDQSESEQFLREARSAAQLKHPNIVGVHEVGRDDDQVFIVSDFVEGLPLSSWLTGRQPTFREAVELCAKMAEALHHAHEAGVIHRDLKPSNIMLDADGEPHIMDFGLAKRETGEVTMTMDGKVLGTPAYMSPEQAKGKAHTADRRTDVYSLGVILFELLTGEKPFRGDYRMLLHQVLNEEAPSPRKLKGNVPRDLDTVCLKCLEKQPEKRYGSAHRVAEELNRFLRGEPVQARPITAPDRAFRWCRRNPATGALVCAVALSLVVGTGVSSYYAIQASSKAEEARRAQSQAEVARGAEEVERRKAVARAREARRLAYLADMFAVGAALENHNIGRARRVLEDYRPRSEEEDLRDFEWFYFDRLARVDKSLGLGTHPMGARWLFAAPDGTFLTAFRVFGSGPFSGPLQIWDGASGLSGSRPLPLDGVTAMVLSGDGKRLAIARGLDIEIRPRGNLGEIETSLTNWHRSIPLGGAVVAMCFCNHDAQLAVAFESGSSAEVPLVLLDTTTDNAVKPVLTSPLTRVFALAASEDGQRLAVSHGGNEVVILSLPQAAEVRRIPLPYFERITRGLTPLMFVNHDSNLVTASDGGRIDIWELEEGRQVATLDGHSSSVTSFAFSPDSKLLASAGLDQVVKLWDLESRGRGPHRVLRGHQDEVWGVAFLPNGRSLVTCGRDESVRLWDLRQQDSEQSSWPLPTGIVQARLGRGLMTAGNDESRWIAWQISSVERAGEPQPILPPDSLGDVLLIPLPHADYSLAISNPVIETRPRWGFPLTLYRGHEHWDPVASFPEFALSRNGSVYCEGRTLFVHGAIEGKPHLLVWDLGGERILRLMETALGGGANIAVSPDESLVVLGSYVSGGRLEVLDLTAGTSVTHRVDELTGIHSLAVLPGNQFAMAGGQPGILCKVELTTGTVTDLVPASLLGIHVMTLSPSATRLATGDAQGKVKLWDVETLREVAVLGTHAGMVTGLQFQPDGRTLLSVDNSDLRIWRME